jgi:hypothetical protein
LRLREVGAAAGLLHAAKPSQDVGFIFAHAVKLEVGAFSLSSLVAFILAAWNPGVLHGLFAGISTMEGFDWDEASKIWASNHSSFGVDIQLFFFFCCGF